MSAESNGISSQEMPVVIKEEMVTLYRIENPNLPAEPWRFGGQGAVSHEALIGQWFLLDIDSASRYLKKSRRVPGAQLVVVSIPKDELDGYHVLKHPLTEGMDVELDNYIIPLEIPRRKISLDDVEIAIGDTRQAQLAEKVKVLLASTS